MKRENFECSPTHTYRCVFIVHASPNALFDFYVASYIGKSSIEWSNILENWVKSNFPHQCIFHVFFHLKFFCCFYFFVPWLQTILVWICVITANPFLKFQQLLEFRKREIWNLLCFCGLETQQQSATGSCQFEDKRIKRWIKYQTLYGKALI